MPTPPADTERVSVVAAAADAAVEVALDPVAEDAAEVKGEERVEYHPEAVVRESLKMGKVDAAI
jgi:hypothetical protein